MIHIVEMREDDPRSPLVASYLSNCFLHEPEMRREAPCTFLCNAFPVFLELVDHDPRNNKREQAALDHFLDDAKHRHLLLIPSKVKPYARVDQHPEHAALFKVQVVAGRRTMTAAQCLP